MRDNAETGRPSISIRFLTAETVLEPTAQVLDIPDGAYDFRSLPSRRVKLNGTGYRVGRTEVIEDTVFVLERQPRNRHDPNAVEANLVSWRGVGFIPAYIAESYAPLLDRIGSKFLVTGSGSPLPRSWDIYVDLPLKSALKRIARSHRRTAV